MAGMKGRSGGARPNSGGARPGAGRPPKNREAIPPATETAETDPAGSLVDPGADTPLSFLLGLMKNDKAPADLRLKAAIAAAPYLHPKMADVGKKDGQRERAKEVGGGRFATAGPPKLKRVA